MRWDLFTLIISNADQRLPEVAAKLPWVITQDI
jgi:hypothetical protein